MRSLFIMLVLGAALAACSSSHGLDAGVRPDAGFRPDAYSTEECPGSAPACYDAVPAWPGCCTTPSGSPSFCVIGSWECPRGELVETRCTSFDPAGVCEGIDAGPPPDWGSCGATSDCTLAASSCCGVCGAPTSSDVDGVNVDQLESHFADVCPVPEPCPDCPSALNPELVATCDEGRCAVLDLGADALSACTDDDQCVLRVPECCECGADTSAWRLVALRADRLGRYVSRVCDPATECLACEPIYPPEANAVCGGDGHCEVVLVSP